MVEGTDPTLRRIPLGLKSRVSAITNLEKGEKPDPLSYSQDEANLWNKETRWTSKLTKKIKR